MTESNDFLPALKRAREESALAALRASDGLLSSRGMGLTDAQQRALLAARDAALADTGRVALGEDALPKLIYAFCDSPYLDHENCFDSLLTLQNLFYQFKNDSEDALSDDELIAAMERAFNGPAQGSPDYLQSLSPEDLYRLWRGEDDAWTD